MVVLTNILKKQYVFQNKRFCSSCFCQPQLESKKQGRIISDALHFYRGESFAITMQITTSSPLLTKCDLNLLKYLPYQGRTNLLIGFMLIGRQLQITREPPNVMIVEVLSDKEIFVRLWWFNFKQEKFLPNSINLDDYFSPFTLGSSSRYNYEFAYGAALLIRAAINPNYLGLSADYKEPMYPFDLTDFASKEEYEKLLGDSINVFQEPSIHILEALPLYFYWQEFGQLFASGLGSKANAFPGESNPKLARLNMVPSNFQVSVEHERFEELPYWAQKFHELALALPKATFFSLLTKSVKVFNAANFSQPWWF